MHCPTALYRANRVLVKWLANRISPVDRQLSNDGFLCASLFLNQLHRVRLDKRLNSQKGHAQNKRYGFD